MSPVFCKIGGMEKQIIIIKDITEHKKILEILEKKHQELEKKHQEYINFFESTPIWIADINLDEQITDLNKKIINPNPALIKILWLNNNSEPNEVEKMFLENFFNEIKNNIINNPKWNFEKQVNIFNIKGKRISCYLTIWAINNSKNNNQYFKIWLQLKEKSENIVPICLGCKKIRIKNSIYIKPEDYMTQKMWVLFSHGICPDCMKKFYPEYCNISKISEPEKI